jgi:hypothetical protein
MMAATICSTDGSSATTSKMLDRVFADLDDGLLPDPFADYQEIIGDLLMAAGQGSPR